LLSDDVALSVGLLGIAAGNWSTIKILKKASKAGTDFDEDRSSDPSFFFGSVVIAG
jgi:hypothetical protein